MQKPPLPLLAPVIDPEGLGGGKTQTGLGPFGFPVDEDALLHETRPGIRAGKAKPKRPAEQRTAQAGPRSHRPAEEPSGADRTARDTVPDADAVSRAEAAARTEADRAPTPTAGLVASKAHDQGTLLAGRFSLLQVLGKGPFGTVYEAEDRELDAFVAIKVLPSKLTGEPRIMDRVRKQLSRARSVVHPNVGRIFDINRDGDVHFVVMEYVPGRTLETEIREGVSPDTARVRLMQVLDALQAIHASGLVHGAVDASHIRIRQDGVLKMTSTGLSCELLHGTEHHPADHRCESPEQKLGEHATVRSDVYAVGALLHALLRGCTDASALSYLTDIADRCLEADPANRFASIPAILEEIERLTALAENRLTSHPVPTAPPAPSTHDGFDVREVPVATVGLVTVATLRGVRGLWRTRVPLPVVLLAVLWYAFFAKATEAVEAVENPSEAKGQFFGWLADAPNGEAGVTAIEATERTTAKPNKHPRHRRHAAKAAPAAPKLERVPGLPSDGAYFYAPETPLPPALGTVPPELDAPDVEAETAPPQKSRNTIPKADAYRTF